MLKDTDVSADIQMYTDASAAKGMVKRTVIGKLEHIDTSQLWIQDSVSEGKIKMSEVMADALTKPVDADILAYHIKNVNPEIQGGRSDIMPEVSQFFENWLKEISRVHVRV